MSGLTRERGDTVIGPRTSQSVLSSLLYRDISAPWKRLKPSWIGEIHLLSVVDDRRCKRRHWHTHDRSFSSVVILGLSGMANDPKLSDCGGAAHRLRKGGWGRRRWEQPV